MKSRLLRPKVTSPIPVSSFKQKPLKMQYSSIWRSVFKGVFLCSFMPRKPALFRRSIKKLSQNYPKMVYNKNAIMNRSIHTTTKEKPLKLFRDFFFYQATDGVSHLLLGFIHIHSMLIYCFHNSVCFPSASFLNLLITHS